MATKEVKLTNCYSKLSAEDYANLSQDAKGIIFEYQDKDGKTTGAMHFFGTRFHATAKTQDEILRTLKAVVRLHWLVNDKEADIRERNDAIRAKLGKRRPAAIILRTDKGETVRRWDVSECDFIIGLFPTKKDRERSKKDTDRYIHNAVIALLEALSFRVEFPRSAKKPTEAKTSAPVAEVSGAEASNAEQIDKAA